MKELKRQTQTYEQLLKGGTLSLQRHRRAYSTAKKTLKERYDIDLNNDQIGQFFKFMDDLRARGIASYKGSGDWADVFNNIQRKELSREEILMNIRKWSEGLERAEKKAKSYQVRVRRYPSSSFR